MRKMGKRLLAAAAAACVALSCTGVHAVAAQPLVSSVVDTGHQLYTYEEMLQDLLFLQSIYPDLIAVDYTAVTGQGRLIPMVTLGNPDAPSRIMVTASMHAREYMTTTLVMKMTEEYAQRIRNGETYLDLPYAQMFNEVCFVIVPMVNPDGVSISQFGADGAVYESTRQWVSGFGWRATQIKANANGVDINRNFPTGWDDAEARDGSAVSAIPSLEFYKGPVAASEAETQNVMKIAAEYPAVMFLNYHTMGNVIYYSSCVSSEAAHTSNVHMERLVHDVTGYPGYDSYSEDGPRGTWADYVVATYQKPSCTIEVGTRNPVPASEFDSIYSRNVNLWAVLGYAVHNGEF